MKKCSHDIDYSWGYEYEEYFGVCLKCGKTTRHYYILGDASGEMYSEVIPEGKEVKMTKTRPISEKEQTIMDKLVQDGIDKAKKVKAEETKIEEAKAKVAEAEAIKAEAVVTERPPIKEKYQTAVKRYLDGDLVATILREEPVSDATFYKILKDQGIELRSTTKLGDISNLEVIPPLSDVDQVGAYPHSEEDGIENHLVIRALLSMLPPPGTEVSANQLETLIYHAETSIRLLYPDPRD